jgi:hypothetical protein
VAREEVDIFVLEKSQPCYQYPSIVLFTYLTCISKSLAITSIEQKLGSQFTHRLACFGVLRVQRRLVVKDVLLLPGCPVDIQREMTGST